MRRVSHAVPRYLEVHLAHARLRRGGRAVLRDVSWTIRPGQRWVLAGGNGAGKTQLLKLIAGIVWPEPAPQPARHYRRGRWHCCTLQEAKDDIAYLGAERQDKYQRYGWNTTVEGVVGTGLHHSDIPLEALSAQERRRVRRALAALAVGQLAARPFLSLSYGERRVVLLARALAARPRLLLLDEVLNGLDAPNRERALRWLARSRRRLPWVLATHRIEDVPPAATHALILDRGRVAYAGRRRGAPLERWLGARAPRRAPHPPRQAASGRTGGRGRALVRLERARVYLDGSRALSDLSLTVRAGECWVVHGRNGAGKTTLLRTLYGDHGVAAGGRIERAGVPAGVPLERFRRRVGLVAPHLQAEHPRDLTVSEVVQSGRYASVGLNGAPTAADRAAAQRALAQFGLTALAHRPLRELSYGQFRRVLFARAWVRGPRLLLLDEPFAGVDVPTRRALMEQVTALAARGAAVVVTTHRSDDWPGCATHELELAAGRARYCGPLRAHAPRAAGAAR
jgi:molybdate transport system ATP-binding protein